MPNAVDHIARTTGCHPAEVPTPRQAQALYRQARSIDSQLLKHLYDGVVGVADNRSLGDQLTIAHLQTLAAVATESGFLAQPGTRAATTLAEFGHMCGAYARLLSFAAQASAAHGQPMVSLLNKQPERAALPNATTRHSLLHDGNNTYEILTWMSDPELQRVQARFASHGGLWGLNSTKSRTRYLHGESRTEHKFRLGAGRFGTVSLARHVQSDTYVALKKSHPVNLANGRVVIPTKLNIIPRLNDGSCDAIARVFLSHHGLSSSAGCQAAPNHGPGQSTYTFMELGVCNLQQLFNQLPTLRFIGDPANAQNATWMEILANQLQPDPQVAGNQEAMRAAGANHIEALKRVSADPFSQKETVRKFINRMAYQMLESVYRMHRAGYAHNDIKPDNFVVARTAQGHLRIKLIDFDLSDAISNGIGVPRPFYATLFSAPQVRSRGLTNNPSLNDAYSAGCSLKALDGETVVEQIQRHALATKQENRFGERDGLRLIKKAVGEPLLVSSNQRKPVVHRRSVEALHQQLPEMAGIHSISDLLCHPHAGKRYSVEKAIHAPPFNQPDSMLDEAAFSDLLNRVIQQARFAEQMLPQQPSTPNEADPALLNALQQTLTALAIRDINRNSALAHLEERTVARMGRAEMNARLAHMQHQVTEGSAAAHMRRLGRVLNPLHFFKSADQKEAEYTYH